MRYAYADPPYPGRAHLYRTVDRADAEEVDHAALVDRLIAEYPDGWALATDSRGLWTVVPLLKERASAVGARIGIWHYPDASPVGVGHPRGRDSRVGWSFEAVVFAGGRGRPGVQVLDHLSAPRPDRRPGGFVGQKPAIYTAWVLGLLGVRAGDEVVDLFPGSGAVRAAIDQYLRQAALWPTRTARSGRYRQDGKLRSSRQGGQRVGLPLLDGVCGQ